MNKCVFSDVEVGSVSHYAVLYWRNNSPLGCNMLFCIGVDIAALHLTYCITPPIDVLICNNVFTMFSTVLLTCSYKRLIL